MTAGLLSDTYTSLKRRAAVTCCICCGRQLADATSITLGAGRTCRIRLGIDEKIRNNAQANELLAAAAIAAEEGRAQATIDLLRDLLALDHAYEPLIHKVERRLFRFRIRPNPDGDGFLIFSPYHPELPERFKAIGCWWRPIQKAWLANSVGQRDAAIAALAELWPAAELLMPSGTVLALSSWEGVA